MRPQQQNRRMRGRGGNNRKGPNPLTRSYESNGPDVKIRGTAQQVADKYAALARDAQSSGDRVMAENYLQHAEHYNRILAAAQAQQQQQQQQQNPRDGRDDYDEESDDRDDHDSQAAGQQRRKVNDGTGPQPTFEGPPAEVALKQQREEDQTREERAAAGDDDAGEAASGRSNGSAPHEAAGSTAVNGASEGEGESEPAPKRRTRTRRSTRNRDSEGGEAEGNKAEEPASSGTSPEAATQG